MFISHSRYDEEIKGFFAQILARKRIAPIFYEWESLGGKYDGEEIVKMLKTTDEEEYVPAVIVLLGEKLEVLQKNRNNIRITGLILRLELQLP